MEIESYAYINERIIIIRFRISKVPLTVVGVYAPEEGQKEETEQFYEQLQNEINKYKNDYLILAGDLNTIVGNKPIPKL
jgi:exonuclease III